MSPFVFAHLSFATEDGAGGKKVDVTLSFPPLLPGVPRDAWLWVTVYQYDDREVPPPEPPKPWPPAGT